MTKEKMAKTDMSPNVMPDANPAFDADDDDDVIITKRALVWKLIVSALLLVVFFSFASHFYSILVLMLGLRLWQKPLKNLMRVEILEDCSPRVQKWVMRGIWLCMLAALWIAMPRYRIDSGDRVRLVYLNENGEAVHPPMSQYLLSTFVPEEELTHFALNHLELAKPLMSPFGIGDFITAQAENDIASGKKDNFFYPYDNLGWDNPISGVYPQAFNQYEGGNNNAVYICNPEDWDKEAQYPLVVFCHGFLGNWQLYQGIWKDLGNCVVLSISSHDTMGIFGQDDVDKIFTFYIPALERMGYKFDLSQLHLIGLSNGGSAVMAAMHSPHAKDFKSITTVSCNLKDLKRVPCQVNFIGGGKDSSASLMPQQAERLTKMGVDAGIFFTEDENHFILVNQREKVLSFLRGRMGLTVGKVTE